MRHGKWLVALAGGFIIVFSVSLYWSARQEQRLIKFIEQKASAQRVGRQLEEMFNDRRLCACQLAEYTVDVTRTDGGQNLELNAIRAGCGPGAPVLLERGTVTPAGLRAVKIELTGLKPTAAGLFWNAAWRIHWDSGPGAKVEATEIVQGLRLDQKTYSADPLRTRIAECLPAVRAK